jgi:hypothetical protein
MEKIIDDNESVPSSDEEMESEQFNVGPFMYEQHL